MKLTIGEAAALLSADEERVQDWIEDDALPAQTVRGEIRINRSDLLEWATQHDIALAPRAFRQERETPSLADALRAGGVHADVGGDDAASAMRNVIALLPVADDDDRETLLQVLLARDRFGVTPVGDGIAIPHVRTPVVLAHSGAVLAVAFMATPLVLSDGARGHEGARARGAVNPHEPANPRAREPIETLFILLSATTHIHLAMLAKLASALKDNRFRTAVRRRVAADEILAIAQSLEERF